MKWCQTWTRHGVMSVLWLARRFWLSIEAEESGSLLDFSPLSITPLWLACCSSIIPRDCTATAGYENSHLGLLPRWPAGTQRGAWPSEVHSSLVDSSLSSICLVAVTHPARATDGAGCATFTLGLTQAGANPVRVGYYSRNSELKHSTQMTITNHKLIFSTYTTTSMVYCLGTVSSPFIHDKPRSQLATTTLVCGCAREDCRFSGRA
jgi:hypothetical protein